MTDDEKDILAFDLREIVYYLTYPSPVPSNFWKDGHGDYLNMNDMQVEHLKACIKLIDNGLKHLRSRPEAISSALVPMAKKKQTELRDVLNEKIEALRS